MGGRNGETCSEGSGRIEAPASKASKTFDTVLRHQDAVYSEPVSSWRRSLRGRV